MSKNNDPYLDSKLNKKVSHAYKQSTEGIAVDQYPRVHKEGFKHGLIGLSNTLIKNNPDHQYVYADGFDRGRGHPLHPHVSEEYKKAQEMRMKNQGSHDPHYNSSKKNK